GQRLERARNAGDLLLAAVARRPAHQLQVVDHDEAEVGVALALQAPRLGTQLQHRQRRRVVDVDGRLGEAVGGGGQTWRGAARRARPFVGPPRASEQSMRKTSCSFDIWSENTATPVCASRAAYCAMLSAKAVLPMLGRPATMIKSPGCSPAVFLSRSTKPVG